MSTQNSFDDLPEGMQFDLLETPEETAAKLKAAAAQEKIEKEKKTRDKKWNEERRKALKAARDSGNGPTRNSDPEWHKKY